MSSKNRFSNLNSKFFLLGFGLALVILIFIFWNILWIMMQNDANRTSRKFLENIFEVVQEVDLATDQTFSGDYYKKLHQKKLNLLKDEDLKSLENYVQTLRKKLNNRFLRAALFSDCATKDKVYCYYDDSTEALTSVSYYNPKSRSWYYQTRPHQDWVLLNEMISGDSRRHGYPGVWGLVLTKRKTDNPNLNLQKNDDGYYPYDPDQLETGLWVSLILSYIKDYSNLKHLDSNSVSNEYFLSVLKKDNQGLLDVDVYFQTLRFPQKFLKEDLYKNISCQSVVQATSLTYNAKSFCSFYKDTIQFSFQKTYHRFFEIFLLGFAFLIALLILVQIFLWFFRIQQKAFQQKLLLEKDQAGREMGATLVHDLKKGVLGKLNIFRFDYEKGIDLEIQTPDFASRFKQNLKSHFQILTLLNRYIDHLMLSFQRKREKDWRVFSRNLIEQYGEWLDIKIVWQKENHTKNHFLEMTYSAKTFEMVVSQNQKLPEFSVPEFALFRIFKNLVDNFHAHGRGVLNFMWTRKNHQIDILISNPFGHTQKKSSGLGLKIIRQILEDNFGEKISVHSYEKNSIYYLEIMFPIQNSEVMNDASTKL